MEPRDEKLVQRPAFAATNTGNSLFAMRVIRTDRAGVLVIYESGPKTGPRILVFESPTGKTELEQYPPGWRKLGDADLLALHRQTAVD